MAEDPIAVDPSSNELLLVAAEAPAPIAVVLIPVAFVPGP